MNAGAMIADHTSMPVALPKNIVIVTGDPSLPGPTKENHSYRPENITVHDKMKKAFASLGKFEFTVIERHAGLIDAIASIAPERVLNFCDTRLFNHPEQEIHIAMQLETMSIPYTDAPPRGRLDCYVKRLAADAMVRLQVRGINMAP